MSMFLLLVVLPIAIAVGLLLVLRELAKRLKALEKRRW